MENENDMDNSPALVNKQASNLFDECYEAESLAVMDIEPESNMMMASKKRSNLEQPELPNVEAVKKTVNTGPKPSFENLISLQLSDGNWSKGAESIILNFFSDGSI